VRRATAASRAARGAPACGSASGPGTRRRARKGLLAIVTIEAGGLRDTQARTLRASKRRATAATHTLLPERVPCFEGGCYYLGDTPQTVLSDGYTYFGRKWLYAEALTSGNMNFYWQIIKWDGYDWVVALDVFTNLDH
jgi:hypothetical protein